MSDYWKDRLVLVTGSSGFVGSALCEKLASLGATVFLFDKDQDILDSGNLDLKNNQIQNVIHLAAQAIVNVANAGPTSTFDVNIRGTWMLLEACRKSPSVESVVVASSDKCYGEPQYLPLDERHPLLALSPYDASKACEDILARTYAKTYDLPITVTRCSNIYGNDSHISRIVPSTILSCLQNENVILRSDGSPLRDYIYIDDVIDAYLTLSSQASKTFIKGEAFNFGTGIGTSSFQLAEVIRKLTDSKSSIKVLNIEKNFIQRQYLSSHKAKTLLAWEPKFSLLTGLGKTIDWYRSNLETLKVQI